MDIQTLAIITLLGSFAVMIFLRFPIAYAVGLSSVLCLLVQDKSLMDVCRLMVKGTAIREKELMPLTIRRQTSIRDLSCTSRHRTEDRPTAYAMGKRRKIITAKLPSRVMIARV